MTNPSPHVGSAAPTDGRFCAARPDVEGQENFRDVHRAWPWHGHRNIWRVADPVGDRPILLQAFQAWD
jgi:hypothetical protein